MPDLSADSWSKKKLVTFWQRKHTELLGRRLMWERLSFLSFPSFLCSFQYFSHLLLFCLLLQSAQNLSSMQLSQFHLVFTALSANTSSSWPNLPGLLAPQTLHLIHFDSVPPPKTKRFLCKSALALYKPGWYTPGEDHRKKGQM